MALLVSDISRDIEVGGDVYAFVDVIVVTMTTIVII